MESKQNKKITIKFFITTFLAMICGGIVGYSVSSAGDTPANILSNITAFLQQNGHIFAGLNLLLTVVSFWLYIKGKKMSITAAQSDEAFEKADYYYTRALNLTAICLILSFIFFSFSSSALSRLTSQNLSGLVNIGFSVLFLVIAISATTALQYVLVNASKTLYPEKRGNVLDTKFQKDWFASCDEAEQKLIGEAAYSSYTAVSRTLPFIFLGCIVLSVVTDMGVVPFVVLGIIWLVLSQSYYITSVKYQKKQRK